jgi:hypothetical protein
MTPEEIHPFLTRRERRHRWMMRLERLFGWELSKKHYRLRNLQNAEKVKR